MTEPKIGDRVRIVYEGNVSESNEEFTRDHTLIKVLQLGPKVRQ